MSTVETPRGRRSPPQVIARDTGDVMARSTEETVATPAALELVFAPLHKRAFGTALGLALGLLLFAITIMTVLRADAPVFFLELLDQYFYGYTVSIPGAFIALGWGFVVGFVAGWFFAFTRNFVLAVSLFTIRTRAQLAATRDFLDHI